MRYGIIATENASDEQSDSGVTMTTIHPSLMAIITPMDGRGTLAWAQFDHEPTASEIDAVRQLACVEIARVGGGVSR